MCNGALGECLEVLGRHERLHYSMCLNADLRVQRHAQIFPHLRQVKRRYRRKHHCFAHLTWTQQFSTSDSHRDCRASLAQRFRESATLRICSCTHRRSTATQATTLDPWKFCANTLVSCTLYVYLDRAGNCLVVKKGRSTCANLHNTIRKDW